MRVLVLVMVLAGTAAADDTKSWLAELRHEVGDAWFRVDGVWQITIGYGGTYTKPAPCKVLVDKLASASVPDSTRIDLRKPTPDLTAGSHTLREVKVACDHVRRAGLVAQWEQIALAAVTEMPKLHAGGNYDKRYFTGCVDEYGKLVKAGIAPSEKVQERDVPDGNKGKVKWAGSVEELRKKWCDAGAAKAGP